MAIKPLRTIKFPGLPDTYEVNTPFDKEKYFDDISWDCNPDNALEKITLLEYGEGDEKMSVYMCKISDTCPSISPFFKELINGYVVYDGLDANTGEDITGQEIEITADHCDEGTGFIIVSNLFCFITDYTIVKNCYIMGNFEFKPTSNGVYIMYVQYGAMGHVSTSKIVSANKYTLRDKDYPYIETIHIKRTADKKTYICSHTFDEINSFGEDGKVCVMLDVERGYAYLPVQYALNVVDGKHVFKYSRVWGSSDDRINTWLLSMDKNNNIQINDHVAHSLYMTSGSKKFEITVDDSGTLSATEVTE